MRSCMSFTLSPSGALCMWSPRIWLTNSPTISLAYFTCSVLPSSRATLPSKIICSSSVRSVAVAPAASGCDASGFFLSAIALPSFCLCLHRLQLRLVGRLQNLLGELAVELLVAFELGEEVCESGAGLEELAQRLDLHDDVDGAEVVHVAELDGDGEHFLLARLVLLRRDAPLAPFTLGRLDGERGDREGEARPR